MKELVDPAKKKYKYNCDRCNKEISFENKTLFQLIVKYKSNKSKKIFDLCNRCYRAVVKALNKK